MVNAEKIEDNLRELFPLYLSHLVNPHWNLIIKLFVFCYISTDNFCNGRAPYHCYYFLGGYNELEDREGEGE